MKDNENLEKKENSKPYIKKKVNSNNKSTNSQKFEGKINDNSANEIQKEREINEYLNFLNKEDAQIKVYKSEGKIYIPKYAIEDQIINREVISNDQKL